ATNTSSCPKGLLSQHIVRNHRYIRQTELAWKSGAVFERQACAGIGDGGWAAAIFASVPVAYRPKNCLPS
ncbi:MAG: hypothetical protein IPM82_19610, partial [Saprospiraceae bacterium]|nr:hypothetical protein [Saprospiraceae bacterium]